MTEQDFKELLTKHDWHYGKSDDDRVYRAGLEEEKHIKDLMKDRPDLQLLYQEKHKQVYS